MTDICLHIIGAGRAAGTLAAAWRSAGIMSVGMLLNRSLESASSAAELIGGGQPCADLEQFCRGLQRQRGSAAQHWLLLGLPDSAVADTAQALQQSWRGLTQADLPLQLAFHLSGQLDAAALGRADAWPGMVAVAAAHPVLSFADPRRALQQLGGSYCVLEAAPESITALAAAFDRLGMHTLQAARDMHRASYHAALVMVSNYQCALHHMAERLLQQAGFDVQQSRLLLASLSSTVASNLAASGGLAALTGPLERGDAAASARLLQAGTGLRASQQLAIRAMANVVLDMAADKGSLNAQQLRQMRALLNNASAEPS